MSFGAIFGDLIESFIKRRLKIPSGAPFTPRDQTDYIVGMIVFSYIFHSRDMIEIMIFCMY
jgi:CDP-2,3-bis-(O-geranylgeranyl)-sn-glycerol synthase